MDPLVAFQDALKAFVDARAAWATAQHAGGDSLDLDERELYLAAKRVLASELPEGAEEREDAEYLRSAAASYLSAFERLRESLADLRRTLEAIANEG